MLPKLLEIVIHLARGSCCSLRPPGPSLTSTGPPPPPPMSGPPGHQGPPGPPGSTLAGPPGLPLPYPYPHPYPYPFPIPEPEREHEHEYPHESSGWLHSHGKQKTALAFDVWRNSRGWCGHTPPCLVLEHRASFATSSPAHAVRSSIFSSPPLGYTQHGLELRVGADGISCVSYDSQNLPAPLKIWRSVLYPFEWNATISFGTICAILESRGWNSRIDRC